MLEHSSLTDIFRKYMLDTDRGPISGTFVIGTVLVGLGEIENALLLTSSSLSPSEAAFSRFWKIH